MPGELTVVITFVILCVLTVALLRLCEKLDVVEQ